MYQYLTKEQQKLASLMSELSEEAWAAGWLDGLEYALWYMVLHGPAKYGWATSNKQNILQLKQFHEQVGGWIRFDDVMRETAILTFEWEALFEQADPKKYLLSMSNCQDES